MSNEFFNFIAPSKELIEISVSDKEVEVFRPIKRREQSHRFFTIKSETNSGCKAVFGFKLISIIKSANLEDPTSAVNKALDWHKNLLKTIHAYQKEIQVNLKYASVIEGLKCVLIFTIYGQNYSSLENILNNFQAETSAFFMNILNEINPYVFEQITEKDILGDSNRFAEYPTLGFYRNAVKTKSSYMGFNQGDCQNDYKLLFPLPIQFDYSNNLFRSLRLHRDVEIDVQLIPQELNSKEISTVRSIIENPSVLDIKNAEERFEYIDHIQKFVDDPYKFTAKVSLKRENDDLTQHLLTSVSNYFFGNKSQVNIVQEKELQNSKINNDFDDNYDLPFFYSLNDVIQTFRLPMPCNYILPDIQKQAGIFFHVPPNLTSEGILVGKKKLNDNIIDIRIQSNALTKHLYIMGQTGTGKSTLIKTMVADCLKNNCGFTVIDPHGDLYDEVYNFIPADKLITINSLSESSCGINPLCYDKRMPQAKSLIINELIRIFGSLYDMKTAGGPMFETYFKHGLLLIMDEGVEEKFDERNLNDLVKLFFNQTYRNELMRECREESVINFFNTAENTTGDQVFANFAIYITSKLNRFVDDYYLAPLLSGKRKNINFRELIDDGKIMLVKLEKGLIGNDNTSLLGQIILSNIILAGMSRTGTNVNERKPHYIFIDEFQNFVKSDIGSALSEVRKYGLNLILANQTLGQLDDYLIQSLLGNVGSMVFFRPGINDYEKIKHYLEPHFQKEDVLRLPNFNCIARLMIDNIPSEPFVFQTTI